MTDVKSLCLRAAKTAFFSVEGKVATSEASIVLANNQFVKDLNFRYRGVDQDTNVLAFAISTDSQPKVKEAPLQLGDIVIARETVILESLEQSKYIADHLCHLVIHGMLHLLGFDHQKDEEAKKMEHLETACLAALGISDPYNSVAAKSYN